MSDALDYLLKARPDALGPYFQFLKQAGKRLDPKTRSLISVITKVHAQTDAGFRQYLRRALRDGATPHEVLDALLMAFPALGLTKIIWAVDVLLDMDIPGFRLDALEAQPDWREVASLDDLVETGVSYVNSNGRSLYIYRNGDTLRVYDSRCPHQDTDIPHLALKGNHLTCPKHQWSFDVVTGECVAVGDRPLRLFPARVEKGRLQVYW